MDLHGDQKRKKKKSETRTILDFEHFFYFLEIYNNRAKNTACFWQYKTITWCSIIPVRQHNSCVKQIQCCTLNTFNKFKIIPVGVKTRICSVSRLFRKTSHKMDCIRQQISDYHIQREVLPLKWIQPISNNLQMLANNQNVDLKNVK